MGGGNGQRENAEDDELDEQPDRCHDFLPGETHVDKTCRALPSE
jgi:hypothetical protein